VAVNFSGGQNYDKKATKTYLNREEFENYVGDGLSLDGAIDLRNQVYQFSPHLSFTFQYSDQNLIRSDKKCFSFKKYIKTMLTAKAWFRRFLNFAKKIEFTLPYKKSLF